MPDNMMKGNQFAPWAKSSMNDQAILEWWKGMVKKDPRLAQVPMLDFIALRGIGQYDYPKAIDAGVRPKPQADHGGDRRWISDNPEYWQRPDKRFYDMLWAETSGGSPEEVSATASLYTNRARKNGLETSLKGSTAYNKKSEQYKKASQGQFNPYEQKQYDSNKVVIDKAMQNPAPYWYMENVNAYGNPPWVEDTSRYDDIGRQRFYERK